MKKADQLFKELLNENLGYIDLKPINQIEATPKADFENKFAAFLAEESKKEKEDEAVKVDSKKVAKSVEEIEDHNFDYKDQKNLDNQIGQEVMNGVYFEAKQNPDKTIDEIKEIVSKNLAKDGQYYMKNAAFGVEGIGYEDTELEEVSGKYAASGYSDKLKKVVKESLMGGVVSSGNPNSFAAQSGQIIKQMMAEKEEVEESYDEFQRDDKGAKGVDKKDKGEEEAFGAGVAKGEKIEKKKIKKESIDSKLAEIGKEAEAVKLEAQLDYLHEYIQEKVDRVSSIQEDANLSELIDKKKLKDMQKEIKLLEKKKAVMEKIYEKSCGKKYQREEIVDEVETINELAAGGLEEKNNPTRGAAGERDPKKVGQSTSAYDINEALLPPLEKMGKEIYNKFDKAGAFNIKAVTSNPGSLNKYMDPVRKDSSLVAIAGDNTELNIFTHLNNLQLVKDIIKGFDIKDSRKDAEEKDVYFKQAKPGPLATNGLVKVVLGSGGKIMNK